MFRPSRNLLYSLHRVKKCCVVYFNQDLSEIENECKNIILYNYIYTYVFICYSILIIFFINSNALRFYFSYFLR